MSRDPEQRFIVEWTTRKDIAEALNDYLDTTTGSPPERLEPDDDRLTDEVCEAYGKAMGHVNIFYDEPDTADAERCEANDEALKACGITLPTRT